jgi:hypothetical protein
MAAFMRPSQSPKATARTNFGGARRHARHSGALSGRSVGPSRQSPQRAHKVQSRTGKSAQQSSQIGAGERRGKGQPQRAQSSGRRAQLKMSAGLRRTRTTARQREVSGGGTSFANKQEFWWKTHLTSCGGARYASPRGQYTPAATPIAIASAGVGARRLGKQWSSRNRFGWTAGGGKKRRLASES